MLIVPAGVKVHLALGYTDYSATIWMRTARQSG
jgi:hypothetical protein